MFLSFVAKTKCDMEDVKKFILLLLNNPYLKN